MVTLCRRPSVFSILRAFRFWYLAFERMASNSSSMAPISISANLVLYSINSHEHSSGWSHKVVSGSMCSIASLALRTLL